MRILIILVFVLLIASIVYSLFRQKDEPENQSSGDHDVDPDHLREQGETKSLLIGIAILFGTIFFLVPVTFGTVGLILLVSVFWLKVRQGQLLGQAVKIGPQQLPDVYAAAEQASRCIGQSLPDIFVTQNPVINAYAMGIMGRKSIVLNSATVEAMGQNELCYVIGHELTHIKCGHTQWMVFTSLSDALRLPMISTVVAYILRAWSRKAEYTADRGGLLACQDLPSSFSAMAKLTIGKELYQQLNIDELMQQKDEVDADLVAKLAETLSDHPYIMHRARSLQQFSTSGYYQIRCDNTNWTSKII